MELDAVNAIHNAIEPCFGRFKLVLLALFKTCDISYAGGVVPVESCAVESTVNAR